MHILMYLLCAFAQELQGELREMHSRLTAVQKEKDILDLLKEVEEEKLQQQQQLQACWVPVRYRPDFCEHVSVLC